MGQSLVIRVHDFETFKQTLDRAQEENPDVPVHDAVKLARLLHEVVGWHDSVEDLARDLVPLLTELVRRQGVELAP